VFHSIEKKISARVSDFVKAKYGVENAGALEQPKQPFPHRWHGGDVQVAAEGSDDGALGAGRHGRYDGADVLGPGISHSAFRSDGSRIRARRFRIAPGQSAVMCHRGRRTGGVSLTRRAREPGGSRKATVDR